MTPSLTIYPAPTGVAEAADIRITANGREVFACNCPKAAFATFAFVGEVTVAITRQAPFDSVVIRPLSKAITPAVDEQTVSFTLTEPANVSVEFDGDIARPVFIFAGPPEAAAPDPNDARVHYFEGGTIHQAGIIELKSNETVYLAGGAVVRGQIRATGASNIRILGPGMLDATDNGGGHMIDLVECDGIEIADITVFGSGEWNVVPTKSRNVHIDNIKIVSWWGASDGIDVVSCEGVLIENCFIRNEDDCVVIKAHDGVDVRDVLVRQCVFWNGMPGNGMEIGFDLRAETIREIVFTDCDIIHVEEGGVLTIHNGDTAMVEDILFDDIRVEDARGRLIEIQVGLSVWSVDCPEQYRPRFKDPDYKWIGSWLIPSPDTMETYALGRGNIRNVTFRNINVTGESLPESLIMSYDEAHGVQNVVIDNLRFNGQAVSDLDSANIIRRDPDDFPMTTPAEEIRFTNSAAD